MNDAFDSFIPTVVEGGEEAAEIMHRMEVNVTGIEHYYISFGWV